MTDTRLLIRKSCVRCGTAFTCGPEPGRDHCWCSELPRVTIDSRHADCLCPACLKVRIAQVNKRGT